MIQVRQRIPTEATGTGLHTWQMKLRDCQPGDARITDLWNQFGEDPLKNEIRRSLRRQTKRKCVYCEEKSASKIDHYRPKLLFPDRTFAWGNFNWSCTDCNFNKGPWLKQVNGKPLLLNPMEEPVEEYLFVDLETGVITPRYGMAPDDEKRASYTIEKLKLNEGSLPDNRRIWFHMAKRALKGYQQHNDKAAENILWYVLRSYHPMRLVVRQLLRTRDPDLSGLVNQCLRFSARIRRYVEIQHWI